ncbi:MAG: NUDIX domain-containing protein [Hyphomicrobiaceae bacterium]
MSNGIVEPYREVAAAIVVGRCGQLLFQQRDDIPGLLYGGLVGLFGGHKEGSETPIETVRREIEEETGLSFPPERFEPLVNFSVAYPGGGGVKGLYYVLRDVPLADVVVTEGSALVISREDLPGLLPRMTPSACYVARLFMMLPQ